MRVESTKLMRAGILLVAAPFLAGGICDGGATAIESPLTYTLDWRFENNYCDSVTFTGSDVFAGMTVNARVGPGRAQNVRSSAIFHQSDADVNVSAVTTGATRFEKTVSVAPGQTTTLNVEANSIGALNINSTGPAYSALTSAHACVAATTWTLEAPVGAMTGNWADNGATGTGTLTLNMPQSVQTGQTVTVGATFTASVTKKPGFVGPETLSMTFSGGLSPTPINATTNLGTATVANPTLSGAVTASFSWTVPAAGPGNRLPFQIITGFGNGHGVGWGLLVTVAYAKVQ